MGLQRREMVRYLASAADAAVQRHGPRAVVDKMAEATAVPLASRRQRRDSGTTQHIRNDHKKKGGLAAAPLLLRELLCEVQGAMNPNVGPV